MWYAGCLSIISYTLSSHEFILLMNISFFSRIFCQNLSSSSLKDTILSLSSINLPRVSTSNYHSFFIYEPSFSGYGNFVILVEPALEIALDLLSRLLLVTGVFSSPSMERRVLLSSISFAFEIYSFSRNARRMDCSSYFFLSALFYFLFSKFFFDWIM